jgi:PAS domain S-box-containing protein
MSGRAIVEVLDRYLVSGSQPDFTFCSSAENRRVGLMLLNPELKREAARWRQAGRMIRLRGMNRARSVDPPQQTEASAVDVRNSERYRALLDSIEDGFCIIEILLDSQGRPHDYRFLETNPAFARHTGLRDVEGKCIRELVPEHEEHWFEFYGRVATTGKSARFMQEARALGERWYDVHAFRVDQPELLRVAVLFSEVSERVRAEQNARLLSEISQDLVRAEGEEHFAKIIGPKLATHFPCRSARLWSSIFSAESRG